MTTEEGIAPPEHDARVTFQEFAHTHNLDTNWVQMRLECDQITGKEDFWYRKDLQEAAKELAVQASEILAARTKAEESHSRPLP